MHDVLLCIGTGKFYNDPNRMKFSGQEFYVKTVEEMARIFPDHPEALENTIESRRERRGCGDRAGQDAPA